MLLCFVLFKIFVQFLPTAQLAKFILNCTTKEFALSLTRNLSYGMQTATGPKISSWYSCMEWSTPVISVGS